MSNKPNKNGEQRKRYSKIVPGKIKNLQLKFFKLIIITILIAMFFTIIGFYGTMHIVLSTADLGNFAERQLHEVSFWIGCLFIIVTLISIIISGILSFHLSHRIAGPIYRIDLILNEMLETGKYTEIRTRPKDELKELVETLNKFIKNIVVNE